MDDIEQLRAEVIRLRADLAHEVEAHGETQAALREFMADVDRLRAERDALRAREAEARDTIAWYANPEIYAKSAHGIAFDNGDLSYHARAWLQGGAK